MIIPPSPSLPSLIGKILLRVGGTLFAYGAYKWIKKKGPTPWGKNLFEEHDVPKD